MKFLISQIIIVILICLFFAALSNLTELGAVGWIIAASTGHALYRIYKSVHRSMKSSDNGSRCPTCNSKAANLSEQMHSFMFDDATGLNDE